MLKFKLDAQNVLGNSGFHLTTAARYVVQIVITTLMLKMSKRKSKKNRKNLKMRLARILLRNRQTKSKSKKLMTVKPKLLVLNVPKP